jgi:hypothetical protein
MMVKAKCTIGNIKLEMEMDALVANHFGTFLDKFNRSEVTAFCDNLEGSAPDPAIIDEVLTVLFKAMNQAS